VTRPPAGLVDTSVFIARESGRPLDEDAGPVQVLVSIVTIAELRAGVLIAARGEQTARRLASLEAARRTTPLPIDDGVAEQWARLRMTLRRSGRRMQVNDAWIASTALAHGLPVVSQDRDYDGIPGLAVVRV